MIYTKPYNYSPGFCEFVQYELQNHTTDSYVYNNAYIRGILKIFGFHETSEIMNGTLNIYWERFIVITAAEVEAEVELQKMKQEMKNALL